MRTYSRNVRRAWDGDDYRPPKRMRVDEHSNPLQMPQAANKENASQLMAIDLEDGLERAIRETSVAAFSSSPSRKNSTIFSLESHDEDAMSALTPPSSPPPPTQLQITPPNVKARKPTFSFLEKQKKDKDKAKSQANSLKRKHDASNATRREDSEPLAEIHNSSRAYSIAPSSSFTSINNNDQSRATAPPTESVSASRPVQPPKPLIQSVLDFGQSFQPVTCAACNMTYSPTVQADTQLHTMYHNRHSSGIELGKAFLKSAMKWCYEVPLIPGSVVVVDRKLSAPSRKVVAQVLEVVNKELGSVDISEEELWSQRPVPGDTDPDAKKADRYKVFLHVIDGKCVGVCLAERISKAFKAIPIPQKPTQSAIDKPEQPVTKDTTQIDHPPTPTSTSNPDSDSVPQITLSQTSYPAVVGVSRIWTSRSFRRKGIANNLLECVMHQFIYGMEIARTEVAFSQPTEMGRALAKSWFVGGESDGEASKNGTPVKNGERVREADGWGWRVYVEE
jgi:N-acetyltransferase